MFITTAISNFLGEVGTFAALVGMYLKLFAWDGSLTLLNLFAFPLRRRIGQVTPEGCPGYGGKWPEFIPPKETDSRSACPALNAMANHGLLPRDGRNIGYKEMGAAIRTTYNFGPSFCWFVPKYMANILTRDYDKDTINLADINVHNGIEHDASLTRHDAFLVPDQSKPAQDLIDDLLASATGPNNTLTPHDLSVVSGRRRYEARETNSSFSLSRFHRIFGSSNSSTMLTIFGGRVDDLRVLLKEERIPEGWESRVRSRFGLTFLTFNWVVSRVEYGIDMKAAAAESKRNSTFKDPASP